MKRDDAGIGCRDGWGGILVILHTGIKSLILLGLQALTWAPLTARWGVAA